MTKAQNPTAGSDKLLARLMALHPKVIDLSLGRLTKLLEKLDNPHNKLPPVVHVAGTNGKGSTVATLRAIAEAAGHRVHVYTSPHLVRFHERIRVAGQLISEESLIETLEEVARVNGDDPITFFEVTTAAAFLAFARTPADLCILEVGLGGRLDATNMIDTPIASVITPVSMDHEQFLGDTLAKIAAEKAGIIKQDCPVIIGPQEGEAMQIIARSADIHNAPAMVWGKDYHADIHDQRLIYRDHISKMILPLSSLMGRHQAANAATAIAVARSQKAVKIPEAAIRAGLGWVRWPGRMHQLTGTELNKKLPADHDLWLDGGHNPAAAITIKNFIHDRLSETISQRPVIFILGMMGVKDAVGYMQQLTGTVDQVIAVDIPNEKNAAPKASLAAAATDAGIKGTISKNVTSAVQTVADQCQSSDNAPFVMLGGSLYLAGSILRELDIYPD